MSKNTVPIQVERDTGPIGGTIETHPAFGLVRLSRVDGGSGVLFGSSVTHHGHISLSVCRCQRRHDYARDWFFGKEEMIEILMTESQFAQMITSWNRGEGSPCTISHVRDGKLESVPNIPWDQEGSEVQRAKDDFTLTASEHLEKFKELRKEATAILEKKSISMGDRKTILKILENAERLLSDAAPFAVKQFIGLAERATAKAKTEVDAFVGNLVARTGLDAIKSIKFLRDKEASESNERYMDEGPDKEEVDR